MPQVVSDIKQFIEICRRKDASCMYTNADFYTNSKPLVKDGDEMAIFHNSQIPVKLSYEATLY
jgi:Ribosomal L38e protein family